VTERVEPARRSGALPGLVVLALLVASFFAVGVPRAVRRSAPPPPVETGPAPPEPAPPSPVEPRPAATPTEPAAPPPEPPPPKLSVRVVDLFGAPVAGARVRARLAGGGGDSHFDAVLAPPDAARVLAEGFTDDAGTLELGPLDGLAGAFYDVEAGRAGYAHERVRWIDDPGASVEVVLHPGAALEGRVVDGTLQPLAGARLRAVPFPSDRDFPALEVESDPSGGWRIDGLRPGHEYVVTAGAPGHASVLRGGLDPPGLVPPEDGIDFVLVDAATFQGTLRDAASREPVGGAGFVATIGDDLFAAGRTGREGRFRFEAPAGARARFPWKIPGRPALQFERVLDPSGDLGDIGLPAGTALSGHVYFRPSGLPVVETAVWALEEDAGGFFAAETAPTDETGAFSFPALSVGAVRVGAVDAAPGSQGTLELAPAHLRLPIGLLLPEPVELNGVVIGTSGLVVEGATVHLIRFAPPGPPLGPVDSGPQGGFRVPAVPDGTRFAGHAVDGDGNQGLSAVDTAGPGTSEVRVTLERASAVSGFVRDADGQAAPGVVVEALRPLTGEEDEVRVGESVSGRDGAFRLAGLVPGFTRLRWSAPGFLGGENRVFVSPAEPLTLELLAERELSIAGQVLERSGGTLALVRIDAAPQAPGARARRSWSTLDGRFRVRGLPRGEVRLTLRTPDGRVHEARAYSGAQDVKLVVEP
jgi:hypothetical protein